MDGEGLEELWALPERLGVLDDDAHHPRARPVRYLDPVPAEPDKLLVCSKSAATAQQGDSALSKANMFADGLTPDMKAQLWKEMQSSKKNY